MIKSTANKPKGRSASKPKMGLGERIRLRRVKKKISQAELGDKLGVSFQQVQKYEKSGSTVGAARLQQIATALDVPVTFFYDDDGKAREIERLLFLDSAFSLRLLRAYSKIKDPTVHRQLLSLMESIAADEKTPPPAVKNAAGSSLMSEREEETVEIIRRVTEWAGSLHNARRWFRSEPIPAFGGRTAEALVKEGKASDVRDFLDHVALGGFA